MAPYYKQGDIKLFTFSIALKDKKLNYYPSVWVYLLGLNSGHV